jgi:hypothetical protein
MKTYGELEVEIITLLKSTLVESELSASRPDRFTLYIYSDTYIIIGHELTKK